ncbi:MAG: hypothetical protein ACJ74W_11800 [Pyrinomonadaceae bacterium]
MDYVILILALAVTSFAAVQFCYLMFLQAANRQQQRRIAELEREVIALRRAVRAESAGAAAETDEVWAEVIDDSASL